MLEDGLVNIFTTLSTTSDTYSIHGNAQAPSPSAPYKPLGNHSYGMPKSFMPSQMPPAVSTLSPRPETAVFMSPPLVEPLNSIPSLITQSRTNELANFVPLFQMVA
jgi:hypothetical protein